AGRGHTDLERVIGMFVNTLALRNQPHGKKTFRQYLNHLKTNTLAAFENQDYQFEDIVEKVAVKRDTSRNPIFDFMLVLQNLETQTNDIPEVKIEALTVKPLKYNRTTARFDMYLTVVDAGEYLKFKLEYATALFKEETVKRCIRYYQNIVAAILENPQTQIAGIEILTGKEREEVLYTFNETTLDYPMAKNLHQLIREQAEKTPRQIAVVEGRHTTGDTESQSLTYAELNEKSARMAQALKEKGVKPGMLVGLMVSRTKEMITALLAVLKAGAAYVPIDPTYPGGRIDYILKQSHPRILLTETHLREKLRDGTFEGEILERTDLNGANNADQTHEGQKEQNATPSDPAYVIYTSGSTGNPKGVMVTHANVVNFITGMSAIIDFSPARRILAVTTLSFDIFVLETLLPLTGGMEIVVADEEQQMEARHLAKLIIHKKIDILQLTPSRLKLLLVDIETSGALKGITHLLVGGEAFPAHLLKAVKRACTGKIYNVYGPTETTVWSCVKELTNTETVNIGKPIANTQVYIMDRYLRPQPPGIAGELLIGGDGVTTGYYENPELTSEKFINYKTIARSSKLVDGKEKKKEEIALTNNHLYRTGDLARWRPDGELEFLGRLDHQVKIRGFRIEIEEIEGTLLTHKNLAEAVVVEKKDPSGE
ncbi:MAG: amino acid adenylation domain-containing protein, partial [bacterium]|nr:amino acid adenylation domain-containing protein [bacterium]